MDEKTDLSRFRDAQKRDFETSLSEIRSGRKRTHWMWYIFPQIKGLGRSGISEYYAIRDLREAKDYLSDGYLGGNLRQICEALLELDTCDALSVFGSPDDLKLRSSMTLFLLASGKEQVFQDVLDRFFDGIPDSLTLRILGL